MKDGIYEAHELPRTLRAGMHDRPADPDVDDLLLAASTIRGATTLPSGARDPHRARDISANQGDHPLSKFVTDPIKLIILRVTGGLGYTKGVWLDTMFGKWERQLANYSDVEKAYYGFPVNPNVVDMDKQLDVFVNTPRSWRHRIPMIDYELYGPRESATCTPKGLVAYVNGMWKLLGGPRHTIIYSGFNFWNAAPFTGLIREMFPENHHLIHMMNAWYFSMNEVANPMRYYLANLAESEWWHPIGGKVSELCQPFIGTGNIDEDMVRVPMSEVHGWAA